MENLGKAPGMGEPATYRIRVRGRLAAPWGARLGGMDASEALGDDGEVITTLLGGLPDQSALTGVINGLCSLHLPVISVECVENQERRTR